MRTASDAFKIAAMHGNVVAKAEVTLADGTEVTFGPQDIMQGGVSVNQATSNAGSFGIGCAVIGRCVIRLLNDHRQLNHLDLSNARVLPSIGANVGGALEWLDLGRFWVEPFDIYDDIVSLSCLDALSRLEIPVDSLSTTFPATLGAIAGDICGLGGLTLVDTAFPNSDYVIQERPAIDGKSALDVLAMVAQVAGCYVVADHLGRVRIKWYSLGAMGHDEDDLDGGGFHFEVDTADGGGFHFERDTRDYDGGTVLNPFGVTALKSLTAGVAPHVVTGLAVSDVEGTQSVSGVDGYVLHIQNNPFVEAGKAQQVAANVAPHVIGVALQQARVSMPGSPTMEAGDPIRVTDRHGETYDFFATNVSWSSTGTLTASCDTESSSPLVHTYRRANNTVDAAQVEGIVNGVLDQQLSDLTDLAAFDDINNALDSINENIGSDYDVSESGSIGDRLDNLEQSTSVGQGIIQVDGVAQTSGTINFVTVASGGGS